MTPSRNFLSSLLCLSLVSVAAGCGGGGFATQPGESVVTDETTSFAVTSSGGGLVPGVPEGAACDPQVWTYTIQIGASRFAWETCKVNGEATDPAAYTPSSGSRVLPATDLESTLTTARAVKVSARTLCGADKPTLHMSVTSSSGSFVYGDDFYACLKDVRAYVESQPLDNLVSVLQERYLGPVL